MPTQLKSRRDWLQILGATGAVGLAGCMGDGGDDDTEQATTEETNTDETTDESSSGQETGSSGATIALATDPTEGTWQVYGGVMPYYTNVLEPLIWVSDSMELEPWLATEWEATGDTTWEFTLRDDVTFHNGDPLTAEAVKFSFEAILSEWSWTPGWLHLDPEGSVAVIDEQTVEFTTTDPFPSFPGTISHNMVAIQHPDRNRDEGEVIGTGPFQVVDRQNQQYVEAEAFGDYWNGDVDLSSLTFEVISDPNTRALALKDHEVDIAYEPPKSQLQDLQDGDDTNAITQLTPGAGAARLNIHKSPTDDVNLRRALNYTVPQETIVNEVLNGVGEPAKGPIAESIYWSAHEKLPDYGPDMEEAQRLVDESSYDGETLRLLVSNNMVDGNLLAQVLQQRFDQIGVSVEIQVMEEAAFDDAVRNGEAHIELNESGTNSGAADYLIYESFHSEGDMNERLNETDDTGLYNPGQEVDELIEQGFQTSAKDEKEQHYEDALEIVMDEAVIIPLYYGEYIVGTYSDIENLDLRPIPEMVRWPGLKHDN